MRPVRTLLGTVSVAAAVVLSAAAFVAGIGTPIYGVKAGVDFAGQHKLTTLETAGTATLGFMAGGTIGGAAATVAGWSAAASGAIGFTLLTGRSRARRRVLGL